MNWHPLASRLLPARVIARSLMAATVTLALNVPQAHAASGSGEQDQIAAENYVRGNLEKGLAVLNNRSVPDTERGAQLRAFLNSLIDTRRLALFSLGLGTQSATPAQIDKFVGTFGDYAISYYETMLLKYYSGQTVRVTGCSKDDSNDFEVMVELLGPAGQQDQSQKQPIEVDFRLVDAGGHFSVTDVAVAGVWLGEQERGRIYDYLLQTNGNIGGVIARLKVSTERLQAPDRTNQANQQVANAR